MASSTSALVTIPDVTLLHIPAPGQEPVTLAKGELTLTALPDQVLALSVDHCTFPVTAKSPVSPTDTIDAHANYILRPARLEDAHPASSSESSEPHAAAKPLGGLGKVKIVLKSSTSPEDYDRIEALAKQFERILKDHHALKEYGYYDEEDEIDAADPEHAGYGLTIADTLNSYATLFSNKLAALTDSHTRSTEPLRPTTEPGDSVKSMANESETLTSRLAEYSHSLAQTVSNAVHEGAQYVGGVVGDSAANVDKQYLDGGDQPGETRQQVNEAAKSVKEQGQQGWKQASLAGQGVADASKTAGSAISENSHKTVAHHFGQETDQVAQSIGQTSANIGSAGVDLAASSTIVQGANAAHGAGQGIVEGPKK